MLLRDAYVGRNGRWQRVAAGRRVMCVDASMVGAVPWSMGVELAENGKM